MDNAFEWVVQTCARDNLEETLNKARRNELEIWNIYDHVVESTSYRAETVLFTVVGLRLVRKKRQVDDLLECLDFAVKQTESQLQADTVLSSEGREWLDKSSSVLKEIREDLIP